MALPNKFVVSPTTIFTIPIHRWWGSLFLRLASFVQKGSHMKGKSSTVKYDSLFPVTRYGSGLRYGQLLIGNIMARVKIGVKGLTNAELMQFLQNTITAATGNANVPTPTPSLVSMQTLLDDGATKINAVEASKAHTTMLRTEREEHMDVVRVAIVQFIAYAEAACGFDAVKLQSLGLTLRGPATPVQPCGTVMGLVATVGDNEAQMFCEWPRLPFAEAYEVQSSPDPLTPTSWVPATLVIDPDVLLEGLISGQKRWVRVRAFNRLGKGAWSDPACRMIP